METGIKPKTELFLEDIYQIIKQLQPMGGREDQKRIIKPQVK